MSLSSERLAFKVLCGFCTIGTLVPGNFAKTASPALCAKKDLLLGEL